MRLISALAILAIGALRTGGAQTAPREIAVEPPPLDRPLIFDSSTRGSGGTKISGSKFRVVPLLGFSYPYALAFLPNGDILVTERAGRLRIVRDGKLDAESIAGIPEVVNTRQRGMNDLALHPRFAENHWIYFTYYKPVAGTNARATLARARYDGGHALSDVRVFSRPTPWFRVRQPPRLRLDAMAKSTWQSAFPFRAPRTTASASP